MRIRLLGEFNIEIGAGLGPLAGKIWRVGLIGGKLSAMEPIVLFLGALDQRLAARTRALVRTRA